MSEDVRKPAAVSESLVPGADRLYFFFGGIAGAIGMPPFEFYRAASILDDSKVFLRDPAQAWYQRGLPGIGPDILAVGDYLQQTIARARASRVTFVGNSMGGFAAILFCALLKQGRAVAFAPQTFVSTRLRQAHGDTRWSAQIDAMHASGNPRDRYELRPWIEQQHSGTRADIYVSRRDALDSAHADQLAGLPQVAIHRFPVGGHGLVRWLRDQGQLAEILAG